MLPAQRKTGTTAKIEYQNGTVKTVEILEGKFCKGLGCYFYKCLYPDGTIKTVSEDTLL